MLGALAPQNSWADWAWRWPPVPARRSVDPAYLAGSRERRGRRFHIRNSTHGSRRFATVLRKQCRAHRERGLLAWDVRSSSCPDRSPSSKSRTRRSSSTTTVPTPYGDPVERLDACACLVEHMNSVDRGRPARASHLLGASGRVMSRGRNRRWRIDTSPGSSRRFTCDPRKTTARRSEVSELPY